MFVKLNKNHNNVILSFSCILFFVGCVSVPKQAVILSEELGNMIRSSESAHLALVDEYIDQRRKEVDKFLDEKWFPDFMKEYTVNSKVEEELKKAESQEARADILREFADDAAKQLYQRRKVMMDSLDKIKELLYSRLQKHYDQMRITNETLTAHLRVASKVTNTRDELIKQLKIPVENIIPLDKLNLSIGKITRYQGKIEEINNAVDVFKVIIKGD